MEVVHQLIECPYQEIPSLFTGVVKLSNGSMYYMKEHILHRIEGPAVINGLGKQFFIEGKRFSDKEDWFNALSEEEKIIALFNLNEWR